MERKKCQFCEKDTIGYQGFGCCSAYVYSDHAHSNLLALRPGEKHRAVNTTLNGFPARNNGIVDHFHRVMYSISGTKNRNNTLPSNDRYPFSDGRRTAICREKFPKKGISAPTEGP